MSKERKKELRDKFYQTDKGKEIRKRLNRVVCYAIILFLFSLYILISHFINGDTKWYTWLVFSGCIIFGLIFMIMQNIIRKDNLNEFYEKDKKKNKKLTNK